MTEPNKGIIPATGQDIADEILAVGSEVAALFIPGSALYIRAIKMLYGGVLALYSKAQMQHGAEIPSLESILAEMAANQDEIDNGKIK